MYICMGGRLFLDVSLALEPDRGTHRNTENDIEINSMVYYLTLCFSELLLCY